MKTLPLPESDRQVVRYLDRFSLIGDGAAVRAASITWFLWLGLLAWRLLRVADNPAPTVHPRAHPGCRNRPIARVFKPRMGLSGFLSKPNPHGYAGQACRKCPESANGPPLGPPLENPGWTTPTGHVPNGR